MERLLTYLLDPSVRSDYIKKVRVLEAKLCNCCKEQSKTIVFDLEKSEKNKFKRVK